MISAPFPTVAAVSSRSKPASRGATRESAEERKRRAARIDRALARAYPEAGCALRHRNAFELLVATILSAQCTDEKVNEVTAGLFARYPTPAALARAKPEAVEKLVHATGFYRQKAQSIRSASRDIVERFGGEVPATLEELVTLRGVARKTANVVLGNVFGVPGLAIDTHMKRVNRRLGLTEHEDPGKIEQDLMTLIPRKHWTDYTHRVIRHGRVCCDAKRPDCDACPLARHCPWPDSAESEGRKRAAS
jgi:endonuclease-3